jgi:hypothetical protein
MNPKHILSAFLFFVVIFLSGFSGNAQNSSDTITVVERWVGTDYYLNNTPLKITNLFHIVRENREAYNMMQKAQKQQVASYFFAIPGGFCVGFSLGYGLACLIKRMPLEKKIFFPSLGVGVVFTGIGIAFDVSANKNIRNGVEIYNYSKKQTTNTNLNLGLTRNGMMIQLNF